MTLVDTVEQLGEISCLNLTDRQQEALNMSREALEKQIDLSCYIEDLIMEGDGGAAYTTISDLKTFSVLNWEDES